MRRLAAKLKIGLGQTVSNASRDSPARIAAAGKRHFGNPAVTDQTLAGASTRARHHIKDAIRKARSFDEFGKGNGAGGCVF